MAENKPKIPDSELEVLEALWSIDQGTVRDCLNQLKWSGKSWSYATVSTLLHRLEEKGLVECDREGFAHTYKATVSRPAVVNRKLEHLIDTVYGQEPGLLVVHLLKSYKLSSEHQGEIKKILEDLSTNDELTAE